MAKAKCEAAKAEVAKAEVAKAKRLSRNENKGKGRIRVPRSLLFETEAPGEESVAKAKLLCGRQNHKTGRPRKD